MIPKLPSQWWRTPVALAAPPPRPASWHPASSVHPTARPVPSAGPHMRCATAFACVSGLMKLCNRWQHREGRGTKSGSTTVPPPSSAFVQPANQNSARTAARIPPFAASAIKFLSLCRFMELISIQATLPLAAHANMCVQVLKSDEVPCTQVAASAAD